MNDRSISEIGHWQLEQKSFLDPVDLYIENLFPGKDYQVLLMVFEIIDNKGELQCQYRGIDIEKVRKDSSSYRKYAYRKGSARGGDVTFTTKLGNPPDKKLNNIKEAQFKKLTHGKHLEAQLFKLVEAEFLLNEQRIAWQIADYFNNATQEERTTTGISLRIHREKELYLYDFETVRNTILNSGSEKKYEHNGTISRTADVVCSVTGEKADEVYGFAAPFKYSTPDKPGFISGFFNKEKFWRNYPVSSKEALALEYGEKYIRQHLTGYFYGYEFLFVPRTVLQNDREKLETIVELLKSAFSDARKIKESSEERADSEEHVQKIIAQQDNFFYVDMLFFSEDKMSKAISIKMMLEEVLPSRFNELFSRVPNAVNRIPLFRNAIIKGKEQQDLKFSFGIIKEFFDDKFLEVVQNIFLGRPISKDFMFEKIMNVIRKNYNEAHTREKTTKSTRRSILEAIMLINYLQELKITQNNINYNFMNTMDTVKDEQKNSRFNLDEFNRFVINNRSFLDSDIKIGIFAVGILVRFVFDIQYRNLSSTPFESKLRGYNLNSEHLMQVYLEALDKIQKYLKNNKAYSELREIINNYFTIKKQDMISMSNNELSFYFVAGLEMGSRFKKEKIEENTESE